MNDSKYSNLLEAEMLFTIKGFTAQLCCSQESKNAAYALRYDAYRSANIIPENEKKLFYDNYDLLPNARTHLIWHEGKPIASVRSMVWSEKYNWTTFESLKYFKKDIDRRIGLDQRILESSRFVVSPEISGRNSLFAQLLLFRAQDLSSQVDDCDYILTAVRAKHVPFYKRMLAFEQISEPLQHSFIDLNIVLLMTTQQESRRIVVEKGMPPCEDMEVSNYAQLLNHAKLI